MKIVYIGSISKGTYHHVPAQFDIPFVKGKPVQVPDEIGKALTTPPEVKKDEKKPAEVKPLEWRVATPEDEPKPAPAEAPENPAAEAPATPAAEAAPKGKKKTANS